MAQSTDGLGLFHPSVGRWFRETLGEPTPPQREGWPQIAAGRHTLICAPTGSGKTLAAFLVALDLLWRDRTPAPGVKILYVSPLKALNEDVSRNLVGPLEGILRVAVEDGEDLRRLTVGVRSGDTPQAERQRLVRRPPDILITTPESLHLMLASRARETLRSVSHVIVDEIHAVCGNKRGVFLALLLERLEAVARDGFVRVGLSATQRPLEEVARYLGGARVEVGPDGGHIRTPRPVAIVDAGRRKVLDLKVLTPTGGAPVPRGGSIWPAMEERLLDLIEEHRSTIVFANNRRIAERLATRLNALRADRAEARGLPPPDPDAPAIRAHHGSLSLDERRSTEDALKRGKLAAVVATASLELGIDMGAVDLVCQIESPGAVSRGLQRVGRAGHVVGASSKGRLFAKTSGDLLETSALCRLMQQGQVETLRVPTNCLDVLAQQVVACVAVEPWDAPALYRRILGAYPYRGLPAEAFESVLAMVSGRFPLGTFRDLRPRLSWDRVHNRLAALPGTARLATAGGGTIPDTGQYPVYLGDGGPRLGELDEEFVLERRAGETFVLGTASWRIDVIEPQKVIVSRAEGQSAQMPFWRGEQAGRSAELGEAVGALCREIVEGREAAGDPPVGAFLEPGAAESLRRHVARQVAVAGAAPDDRTILVESFRDPAGETGLAILSPFGSKFQHALKLVVIGRLRDRLGVVPACLSTDDGLLIRLPGTDDPPVDVLDGLTADDAEALARREVAESALFGLRFRQNAGRALLLSKPDPTKRTPLWVQRLRAKDLLQVVRKVPDFPVVVETFRECLDDDLELPRLRALFDRLRNGSIRLVTRRAESPSPFVSELLFWFEHQFLYQWDDPQPRSTPVDETTDLLERLRTGADLLDAGAIGRVESRLRGRGRPPRTVEEAAEWLRAIGDAAVSDLEGPTAEFLGALEGSGRVVRLVLRGTDEPERWVLAEDAPAYGRAFPDRPGEPDAEALGPILGRFLGTRALVGIDDLLSRYPIDPATATDWLERREAEGGLVRVGADDGDATPLWGEGRTLTEVRRLSIALRRKEAVAVTPEVYADFLIDWQGVGAEADGPDGLDAALEVLQGFVAPAESWEVDLLPARVRGYRPDLLDAALAAGDWSWRGDPGGRDDGRVGFVSREGPAPWASPDEAEGPSEAAAAVLEALERHGACFAADLARLTGIEPSRVRGALDELARLGRVTNDRFDPMRPGASAVREALAAAPRPGARRPALGRSGFGAGRRLRMTPEGRWSRTADAPAPDPDAPPDPAPVDAWAAVLLRRYGVLSRETAALDRWAPPWRHLAERLSLAELRGEVRRGYFVEGLSGGQYATTEAAEALARRADRPSGRGPVLLSALDPANPYGSGAPFDVGLMKEGSGRLLRAQGHYIVVEGGRPVLVAEANGRRLTVPGAPGPDALNRALALLPALMRGPKKILRVETIDGLPALSSPVAPQLAALGFVRDYPAMTLYVAW